MFPEGGGFVNITVPEGGPTATGMNPEGGTAKKVAFHPPHRLISGTALSTMIDMLDINASVQNCFVCFVSHL